MHYKLTELQQQQEAQKFVLTLIFSRCVSCPKTDWRRNSWCQGNKKGKKMRIKQAIDDVERSKGTNNSRRQLPDKMS